MQHSYTMQRSCIRARPLRGFHLSNLQSYRRPQDDTITPPATTPQANPITTVEINQNDPDTSPKVTTLTPADFWTKITPTHTDLIKKCYSEVVPWKPQFVTLSKNKTGHCFIESLSIIRMKLPKNRETRM